ncbi:hypothetical protein FH5_00733 [Priestia endophytica]|nr:hypothetical protein FH5_00733 [Priestia endophytica]
MWIVFYKRGVDQWIFVSCLSLTPFTYRNYCIFIQFNESFSPPSDGK